MARISKGQQREVRHTILNVAKTYFYHDGYEKTSTKKIAKKAGIAEGTIFNYFPSKADLFFEAIREDYFKHNPGAYYFEDVHSKIPEVIVSYIFKTMGFMLKLPKGILLELFFAAMKIGKKNPERLRKLTELDFEYLEGLNEFLKSLLDKGMIQCQDTKQMSEIIFGSLMFELTMYLYESSITREMFRSNVERKVELIIDGMIQGGK